MDRSTDTADRVEFAVSWAPNGRELAFWGFVPASGESRLYTILPDGTGEAELSTAPRAPFGDTFEDGLMEGHWFQLVSGTGVSIAETGGRLEISFALDATPGGPFNVAAAHWSLQCRLPADFDMQVDYTLLEWPANNGVLAQLAAFFANAGMARHSHLVFGDGYTAYSDGTFTGAPTADTAGALRLVRAGGVLRAYYRGPLDWVLFFEAPANGSEAAAGLDATLSADQLSGLAVRVAYDNFRLNAGTLNCPSWWQSEWPDWGRAVD
jgi:hypothetical protein